MPLLLLVSTSPLPSLRARVKPAFGVVAESDNPLPVLYTGVCNHRDQIELGEGKP